MKQKNIFEIYLRKKQFVIRLAKQAREYGWIDENREKEIVTSIENDVLTIGVIGQINCGKSTFLNSIIFEDDILPAAITPMTASLSVITYGDTPKISEFYSEEEWQEQCELSEMSLPGSSEIEDAKIKVAKVLVNNAAIIKGEITDCLGKVHEDTLDKLLDYVGAEGRYTPITKLVRIYYPKEYLKGVEIVDTPGFNDPVKAREQRTKEFLATADVVIMLLSAGRPFALEDRTVLFENVRSCGIGKVLIGINKYDIPFERAEHPDDIKNYVKEQIKIECKRQKDNSMADILKGTDPLLLSAEMALLSELPEHKISDSEIYSYAINRYSKKLGITGPSQLREMSKIDEFSDAIKDMIENEKLDILIKKPISSIIAAGEVEYERLVSEISTLEAESKIIKTPDRELQLKESNLNSAKRRLERRINTLEEDLNLSVYGLSKQGRNDMEDALFATCSRMDAEVNRVGVFQNFDNILPRLDQLATEFETRTLKRLFEQLTDDMKRILRNKTREFFNDSSNLLEKYIDDIDVHAYVGEIENLINTNIDNDSIFGTGGNFNQKGNNIWGNVINVVAGFGFGLIGLGALAAVRIAFRGINHAANKQKLLTDINQVRRNFDAQKIVDVVLSGKENVISIIKQKYIDGLIVPLQQMIADCQTQQTNKEQRIKYLEDKLNSIVESRNGYERQKAVIDNMVAAATLN